MPRVKTGLDRLVCEPRLRQPLQGRRLALLANQASVTADVVHAVAALPAVGLDLSLLFTPEHGIWGHAQDMEAVDDGRDPVTGLHCRSLYGDSVASLRPDPGDLVDIDALLIDLPDIGTRYYTFAATALYCARSAVNAGVEVWVLDRPNPIGGVAVEGNLIEAGYESFVSAISVPNRHGLTLAELLVYSLGDSSALTVVEASGWERSAWHDRTGLPWVAPSPNMPTLVTAAIYPGMCLLEATNVSEGRGTTQPFELFGAPFVDAPALARTLDELALPGLRFRPTVFQPGFQKWARKPCSGVQVHIVERERVESYKLGLAVVWALHRLHPSDFAWRDQPYEFVTEVPAIDLLCGTDRVRLALDAGADLEVVWAEALSGADAYEARRRAAMLYAP